MPATDTQPLATSVLAEFTHTLRTMAPDGVRRCATRLQTTGGDLDGWQTIITVDRRLRDGHLSRRAATAARAARDVATVTDVADGIDAEVIAVARAASDAARALVPCCLLTDANSFAVGCEPVAPSDPNRATGPSAAA
ncbi:MAG: hypothetical protein E6G06_01760 [Actinobacteria bacterium]|nr:MAG: hypothetical protein E6G06_01760 [Actinomycetota bacterium]